MVDASIKDTGVEKKSDLLLGQHIAVAVSGGIGAVEVVKIMREIRRHGAVVTAFMTESAKRFITETSLCWAAGQREMGGESALAEHLDDFDAVVVVPATLNTISKAALGIADNKVCLLIASVIGSPVPLIFVPTMNQKLLNHPLYSQHQEKLVSWGARFFETPTEEARQKMPEPQKLVQFLIQSVGAQTHGSDS